MILRSRVKTTSLTLTKGFLPVALFGLATLYSCQNSPAQEEEAVTTHPQEQTIAADTVQTPRRPAPEFHRIPTEQAKKRVYICDDQVSDIFHAKHDCPVLIQCKATFRNVSLLRAVEEYDRYQCDTCSQDLAFIFEEGNVK